MPNPLFIAQCMRLNGVVSLTVVGHGLTGANVGNKITVIGCPDNSVNVVSTIARVSGTDGIVFNQNAALPNIHGLSGGAVAIG